MGFGNPCRSDDGIGVYVADRLRDLFRDREDVSVFDMGTGAFEVLFKLRGHDRIVMVDAVVDSGEPPGTMFCLPAEEVMRAPQEDPMVFLHSIKWDQALSYAKRILKEEYPDDVEVYLVSIEDTRLEIRLSEPVREAGDRLVTILAERFQAPIPMP